MAIDAAGNVGPEATFAYTIQPPQPQVVVQEVVRTVPAVDQAPPVQPLSTPLPAPEARRSPADAAVTGLSYGRIVKLATATSKGMRIKMVLPAGTRSLDVSIRRGGKLIARRTLTSRAGAYAHALKLTRKGAYTVVLRAQGTRAGTPATFTLRSSCGGAANARWGYPHPRWPGDPHGEASGLAQSWRR